MEVAEKKEWDFKGVAPRREKNLRNIIGGGEVEEVVIREEMLEEEITAEGEERRQTRIEGLVEQREEGVLESVEPVFVVVFEWEVGAGFLAREKRERSRHYYFCRS